ncbi:MAG: hypothetical protein U0I48_03865 [Acutalibacteraceae bacterium]|nr:hypothetical protein [Acutalibacteraceae bacterium]
MTNDFYARWFSRTQPKPPSPEELWERHTSYLRNFATSPLAEKLVQRFEVPEVEEAEEAFKEAIRNIPDPELRNTIDMAAGKLTSAYQILGFCAGHFSTDSRAQNL